MRRGAPGGSKPTYRNLPVHCRRWTDILDQVNKIPARWLYGAELKLDTRRDNYQGKQSKEDQGRRKTMTHAGHQEPTHDRLGT